MQRKNAGFRFAPHSPSPARGAPWVQFTAPGWRAVPLLLPGGSRFAGDQKVSRTMARISSRVYNRPWPMPGHSAAACFQL